MIRVAQIIDQLRAECPEFATVTHALTSSSEVTRPAALVAPLQVDAEKPAFYSLHSQMISQTFGVYILIDRAQDGDTGYGSADLLDVLVESLRAALIGWTPDNATAAPLAYGGGKLDRYQQQIACWRDDFVTSNELRTA